MSRTSILGGDRFSFGMISTVVRTEDGTICLGPTFQLSFIFTIKCLCRNIESTFIKHTIACHRKEPTGMFEYIWHDFFLNKLRDMYSFS